MSIPEGERLIAMEAAMQELGSLQTVARSYRSLRPAAEALLSQLLDLGSTLRQATRRGPLSEDLVETTVSQILRIRTEWQRRLEDLRASTLYQDAVAAYAADDQDVLVRVLPSVFADLAVVPFEAPLYQSIALTSHRRPPGGSPFRPPPAVADAVQAMRDRGLMPRAESKDWWDTDLPSLAFVDELAAIDSAAAAVFDELPHHVKVFRLHDSMRVFTPRLSAACSVVLAESSDDTWWEAKEGSYEQYREALRGELQRRRIPVQVVAFDG